MVLLIFTSVAIMSIAHRTGSMSAGPMASIVLLFMVMPIMPWGLREASIVVGLSYLTITFSFLSVEGRFDQDTLWTAQFLILASATTAVLTMVRNTLLRKDEIRSKFDLEKAHRRLESMSMRDPLTGAWNRRFLEQKFDVYAECSFDANKQVRLALMDIDEFKRFNDTYGHHHGDLILCQLAKVFKDALPGNSHLIRIGGDEFAVLYATEEDERLIRRCLRHLSTDPILLEKSNGEPVYVSVGYATGGQDIVADLASLYVQADESLYQAKSRRGQATFYDEPTLTSFHDTDPVGAAR